MQQATNWSSSSTSRPLRRLALPYRSYYSAVRVRCSNKSKKAAAASPLAVSADPGSGADREPWSRRRGSILRAYDGLGPDSFSGQGLFAGPTFLSADRERYGFSRPGTCRSRVAPQAAARSILPISSDSRQRFASMSISRVEGHPLSHQSAFHVPCQLQWKIPK